MISRFRVIEGGDKPKSYHTKGEPQQVICRVCETDIGIATSLLQRAVQSPMRNGNRMTGGTSVFICVHCILRGKVTVIT